MATSPRLAALALVLWGAFAGQPLLGGGLAFLVVVLAMLAAHRRPFGESELDRAADLAQLAGLLLLIGFVLAEPLPGGLLRGVGWLPLAVLPLLLVALAAESPLRLRHLAHLWRRRDFAEAEVILDPMASFGLLCVLAAGVLTPPGPAFLWAAGAWCLLWRWPAGRGVRSGYWLAALVALALGWAGAHGLSATHQVLQDWVVDAILDRTEDPYRSQTRIGDLGRINLSERIDWRLEVPFGAASPARLRQGVYSTWRNGAWLARRDAFALQPVPPADDKPGLVLRGKARHGEAVPPLPLGVSAVRALSGAPTVSVNSFGLVRMSGAPADLWLRTAGPMQSPAPPTAADREVHGERWLDRLPELAALSAQPAAARVERLAAWFGEHFRYTLELGSGRGLSDFLFGQRAGHCEYFASATVLLLRELGLPARYVTGYAVNEYSRLEKAFVLRGRHAHAWVEVWVDGAWHELDTTPSTWLSTEEQRASVWQPVVDFLDYAVERFGRWRLTASVGDWLVVGGVLVLPMLWLLRRRVGGTSGGLAQQGVVAVARMDRGDEFALLEARLAAAGWPRQGAETPQRWLERLRAKGVPDEIVAPLASGLPGWYVARYGRDGKKS